MTKNQLPPPCFVTAEPVTLARFQLSYVQCTVLALHDAPLSAEDPPAVTMQTRSFSAEMAEQASATAELVRSVTMSTPSLSYHPRRMPTPTSQPPGDDPRTAIRGRTGLPQGGHKFITNLHRADQIRRRPSSSSGGM